MNLPGKKPEKVEKRLKAFFYGGAGVGKTTACIQFPNSYYIDTEGGATNDEYIEVLNKNNCWIYNSNQYDEILNAVKCLLTTKHEFKTIVIDSFTPVYQDLIMEGEKKLGTKYGAHYNAANKKVIHLINLLVRLDMNVIITSHAKNEYGDNMSIIGQTFDCYKKFDHLFDLMFEIRRDGSKRVAYVKKTRCKDFVDQSLFEFSYKEICNRYGKKSMEKEVKNEELATPDQVKELEYLIKILQIDVATTQKWLAKAKSESFDEMPQTAIVKCIQHLNDKIKGEKDAQ